MGGSISEYQKCLARMAATDETSAFRPGALDVTSEVLVVRPGPVWSRRQGHGQLLGRHSSSEHDQMTSELLDPPGKVLEVVRPLGKYDRGSSLLEGLDGVI